MTPEGALKKAIKEYLRTVGAFWSMIPGGSYAKTGDPDMVVCYKGRYIAVEAKVDTPQSNWQKMRQVEIERAGGRYLLVHSVDEVRDEIEAIDEATITNK